jgi:hypothetical protein
MGALLLKMDHCARQLVGSHCLGVILPVFLADLVILAKHAPQVASGEKNSSGPLRPRNRRFLAEMQTDMGDRGLGADPAETDLSFNPVYQALARAAIAVIQVHMI